MSTGHRTFSRVEAEDACVELERQFAEMSRRGWATLLPAIGVDLAADGSMAVRVNIHSPSGVGLSQIPQQVNGIAVVVKQTEMPHAFVETEVGAEKPHPQNRRTAHVKGPSKAFVMFAKVVQAIAKGVVTFFTGPMGAKGYDALLDATHTNVSKMHAGEKAKWFNDASNPDMYVWALGLARSEARKYLGEPTKKEEDNKKYLTNRAVIKALGVTLTSFNNLRTAMIPCLKMHLGIYLKHGHATNAHAIQSILLLFYGGLAEPWELVKTAREQRPKLDWNSPEVAPTVAGWVDALVKAIEPRRTVAEGADNPALEYA